MNKSYMYHLDDFNNFVLTVENDSDIAIYRALLEGIRGDDYSEIKNLKSSSIEIENDKFFVNLCNEEDGIKSYRKIEISEQLYEDLICADHQTFYLDCSWNTDDMDLYEYEESPYIFKPLEFGSKSSSDGKMENSTIKRCENILNHYFAGKSRNAITFVDSGTVLNVQFKLNWKMER